jgi:2-methylaconitate cis-trans-isomerase PrpF
MKRSPVGGELDVGIVLRASSNGNAGDRRLEDAGPRTLMKLRTALAFGLLVTARLVHAVGIESAAVDGDGIRLEFDSRMCSRVVASFAGQEGLGPFEESETLLTAGGAIGDFALDGVPGTGARIALDFLDPGGAVTGRLLPTGRPQDLLEVPGLGAVAASLVDATNPMVFVRAKDLGLDGTERPEDLDGRAGLPARLEAIRAAAAVRMALARTPEEATRTSTAVPKIAIVAPPAAYRTLAGATVESHAVDVVARIVSMGKVHRAFALTGAMCLAVAARLPGTLAHEAAALGGAAGDVRIGHPSGVLPIASAVRPGPDGAPVAETVTVYRTARRLMEGFVLVP